MPIEWSERSKRSKIWVKLRTFWMNFLTGIAKLIQMIYKVWSKYFDNGDICCRIMLFFLKKSIDYYKLLHRVKKDKNAEV